MKTYIKPIATITDVDLKKALTVDVGSGGGYGGPFTKKTDDWEYEDDDFEDGW